MHSDKPGNNRSILLWFMLLSLPFYLNDFSSIFVKDYRLWLAVDYLAVKAFPLAVMIFLIRSGRMSAEDFGLIMPRGGGFLLWTLIMTAVSVLVDQLGWPFLERILPDTKLGAMPKILSPWMDQVDLYFGLLCVAFFEETVFRGLAYTVLRERVKSTAMLFVLAALIFGLIHWSLGLHAIVNTAVIGAVYMTVMQKTGSVLPAVIAHFFVNYLSFSGILSFTI